MLYGAPCTARRSRSPPEATGRHAKCTTTTSDQFVHQYGVRPEGSLYEQQSRAARAARPQRKREKKKNFDLDRQPQHAYGSRGPQACALPPFQFMLASCIHVGTSLHPIYAPGARRLGIAWEHGACIVVWAMGAGHLYHAKKHPSSPVSCRYLRPPQAAPQAQAPHLPTAARAR
jgi:hypothetical protein